MERKSNAKAVRLSRMGLLEYIIPEAVKHFMTQVKFALEMFSRSVTRAMAPGTGSFV